MKLRAGKAATIRRIRALKRLRKQLASGERRPGQPLTDADRKRINKEIATLESRLQNK